MCFSFLTFFPSRFLSLLGGSVDQIGSAGLKHCVESKVNMSCIEELAKKVDTTPETLKLIIDGLTQPPGFDIRQSKRFFFSFSRSNPTPSAYLNQARNVVSGNNC